MVILNIVWTLGLYIMWLRASMMTKQRGRKKEDVAGEQKAVLELAAAMREQVKGPTNEEGDDVSTLMEAKLHRLITKDLRGGSISYKTPLLLSGESGDEWNTKAWIKSHKLPTLATGGSSLELAHLAHGHGKNELLRTGALSASTPTQE
ncbi:unnamed protein product [Alternaria alternata]